MFDVFDDAMLAPREAASDRLECGSGQTVRDVSQELSELLAPLRDDEVEILWDLLSDLPLKAIAAKRNISRRTVQFRKKGLLDRFGCRSLLELAAFFAARGISVTRLESDFFSRFRIFRRE